MRHLTAAPLHAGALSEFTYFKGSLREYGGHVLKTSGAMHSPATVRYQQSEITGPVYLMLEWGQRLRTD